jgi:hypothetical protein
VLQNAGRPFPGVALLIVVSPNRKLTNHQVLIRIGDTVERPTALTSVVKFGEGLSYRNRHEPKPNLFVLLASIQI